MLAFALAFAQEPDPFRQHPDGSWEVVVRRPDAAREALVARLAELGWAPAEEVRGGQRYRSNAPVQPFVTIYEDGRVEVQEHGVVTLRDPPEGIRLGRTGVRLGGPGITVSEVISARKLHPRRMALMEAIRSEVTALRVAHDDIAWASQLDAHLPRALQALWDHGEPLYGAETLPDAPARRRALLAHWGSRACTPDGDAAAAVVARFLQLEVDPGPTPSTDAERAHAEAHAACGRTLPRPAPPQSVP